MLGAPLPVNANYGQQGGNQTIYGAGASAA
jgi:hypothetical protein